MENTFIFLTGKYRQHKSTRKLKNEELRYCQHKKCRKFIYPQTNAEGKKHYYTIWEYKKRKFCNKSHAASTNNPKRVITDEWKENLSIGMYKYYDRNGFYDREKDGAIPYQKYKKYVQTRSKRTLKRENPFLHKYLIKNAWNPKNPNSEQLTIDHKISIRQCYDNGFSIKEASNIYNLEVITMKENWRRYEKKTKV